MSISFVLAMFLIIKRGEKEGYNPQFLLPVIMVGFFGSVIGGRALYIFTQWEVYLQNPLDIFMIRKGGQVYFGGLIGAAIAMMIFLKIKQEKILPFFDLFSPYSALGLAIHRTFGCFFAGCCYGKPTALFWGVVFPPDSIPSRAFGSNVPVHPSQLYEALSAMFIFFVLLWYRKRKRQDGEMALLFLIIYSFIRFFTEFLRGDNVRGFIGIFSTSQFIGILIFSFTLLAFYRLRKTKEPVRVN